MEMKSKYNGREFITHRSKDKCIKQLVGSHHRKRPLWLEKKIFVKWVLENSGVEGVVWIQFLRDRIK